MIWRRKKHYRAALLVNLFVTFIVAVVFFFGIDLARKKQAGDSGQEIYTHEEKMEENPADEPGKTAALFEEAGGDNDNADTAREDKTLFALASENYEIAQLSFSGNLVNLDDMENLPLELYDIRGEASLSKDEKEAKLFLSWKTSKLAISEVEYSRSGDQSKKTIHESEYGFQHAIIIPGLDPASTYTYRVETRDHWGNAINSGYYAVYTGSRQESVFNLISKELDKLFGWALKK